MSGLWVFPTCPPLTTIAPTTVNALSECPRRVAFQRDDRTKGLARANTRTALGRVSHRLTELVLRGDGPEPHERRTWLEAQWANAISEQVETLSRVWVGRQVPLPERWPGYVATRTRLIRRLTAYPVAARGATGVRTAQGGGQPPLPWVERKLTDDELGLFGTPDLVEERDGALRVVDLKSGVHQHGVKASQLRQLLLYAHLVSKALGRPVDQVAIVDVGGHEIAQSVTYSDIAQALSAALCARSAFNRSLEFGEVVAIPAQETCRFCPFKIACRAHWEARQDDWGTDVAVGVVTDLPLPNVAVLSVGESFLKLIVAEADSVKVGDHVAASGLAPAGPDTFRMRWDGRLNVG